MKETPRAQAAREISDALAVGDVMDEILDAISNNLKPEDVFNEDALADWAENNGFTKED